MSLRSCFAWVSLAIFTLGCSSGSRQLEKPSPPIVIYVEATSATITDFDEFVGRTEASETVDVRARVSGYLRTVEFGDGNLINKGDLLATIEPDEYQALYDQKLANIELWKSKLDLAETSKKRFEELLAQNAVSQSEYDESLAAVKEANAQIAAAEADAAISQLDLEYTEIHAPISGRLDRAFITPGNMVSGGLGSGTLLTRIVNDTPMYAYLDVDEQSLLDYKRRTRAEGQSENPRSLRDLNIECSLQLQDEKDFPHKGFIDFAENRVDAATGTIRIRAILENQDLLLQGGLFVRVRIPKGDAYQGVLVPEQAIGMDQADRIVYVVNDDNKVERRVVELGVLTNSMRAIKSGVRAGERVIFKGLQRVRPGIIVQPEKQSVSEPSPEPEISVEAE